MTMTDKFEKTAFAAVEPLPRPLNVVGPYSLWPRNRGVVNATPIVIGTATLTGATFAHCVLPVLV